MSTTQKVILFSILTVCMINAFCVEISPPPPTSRECTANETLNECVSPCAIEPTCELRNPPIPGICIQRCDRRCECKPDYIRIQKDGKCIKQEQCPSKCGLNEIFNECASPCAVEPTCADPNPTTPVGCIERCDQRCQCQPGSIRITSKGPCIKAEECK